MTVFAVNSPFLPILALNGLGLNEGQVYIGAPNTDPVTNPQAVYWDITLSTAAAQPLDVLSGYVMRLGSPAQPYTAGPYSIKVVDAQGVQVFYQAYVGNGAQPTVMDYGAKGDGVTDDAAAFQAAINSGICIIPYSAYGYRINTPLNATNRDYLMIQGAGFVSAPGDMAYAPSTVGSTLIANTGAQALLDITGCNNVTLRDFNIISANQTSPLPSPSQIGIVGGTGVRTGTGSPGGGATVIDNVCVLLANVGTSLPIYLNNANVFSLKNVHTMGKYGIAIGTANPLAVTPPYGTFGAVTGSFGNTLIGCSMTSYGDQAALYLQNVNDFTCIQSYAVFAGGAAGHAYSGLGYALFMDGCNDCDIKMEVDYFPYMFLMAGVNTCNRISGVTFSGPTETPGTGPAVGLFAGPIVENCKFDINPAGNYSAHNNYLYSAFSGSSPPTKAFINCDFWYNLSPAVSANMFLLNVDATYSVPFVNCTFRGTADIAVQTTPFLLQINGSNAAASAYRCFMNGVKIGTA